MWRGFLFLPLITMTVALPALAESAQEEATCVFPRCSNFKCDATYEANYIAMAGLPKNALNLAATNHTVAENIRAVSSCLQTPFYGYVDSEKNPYAFLVQLHYVIGPDKMRHTEKPSSLCFIYEIERGNMDSSPTASNEDGSETAPEEILQNRAFLIGFNFIRPEDNLFATSAHPAWEKEFSSDEHTKLASAKEVLASPLLLRSEDLPSSAQWYLKGKQHPLLNSAVFRKFLQDKSNTLPFADCLK